MIQMTGSKRNKRYVLAEPDRTRVQVKRQYMRVGDNTNVCYMNKIYEGVVEEKGAGGSMSVKYKKFKGQSQAYRGAEWRSYVAKVRGSNSN